MVGKGLYLGLVVISMSLMGGEQNAKAKGLLQRCESVHAFVNSRPADERDVILDTLQKAYADAQEHESKQAVEENFSESTYLQCVVSYGLALLHHEHDKPVGNLPENYADAFNNLIRINCARTYRGDQRIPAHLAFMIIEDCFIPKTKPPIKMLRISLECLVKFV